MDILRTLNSILTPGVSPVNRARPAVPVTETQAGQRTFAQTLEEAAGDDPSIAPFGVSGRRTLPSQPSTPETPPRPQIEVLAPGTANPKGVFTGPGGPTILPENPAVDHPALDRPIDQLHVEIGDTLQSIVTKDTERLTKPEPLLPPPDDNTPATAEKPWPRSGRTPMPDDPRLLAPDGGTLAQYAALASGTTAGGNFELFKDGAKLGFFTDDQAGFSRYLQYNGSEATPRLSRPEFCGWTQAADLVYAVRVGEHQGNDLSPVWTGSEAYAFGRKEILGLATAAKWTPQQRQDALNEYSTTFKRLYSEWEPKGPPLANS